MMVVPACVAPCPAGERLEAPLRPGGLQRSGRAPAEGVFVRREPL